MHKCINGLDGKTGRFIYVLKFENVILDGTRADGTSQNGELC